MIIIVTVSQALKKKLLPLRIPCSMSSSENTYPPMLYDVFLQKLLISSTDLGTPVSQAAKPWIVREL